MKLLKTIVVAVDFDDISHRVLAETTRIVKQFGAEVILLHVIEPSEEVTHGGVSLEASIQARLEEYQSELTEAGVSVTRTLWPHGKPFVEIISAADHYDANLIVLGAQGISPADQYGLGSTAEKVMRRSSKAVLAVHHERSNTFANILCPVDFSETSAQGLTDAIRLARSFQSKLHVLTVMAPPSRYQRLDLSWAQWAVAAEAAAARQCVQEFEEFLHNFDFLGVKWEKKIARGDAAHEIIDIAKACCADLIVMGSVGRTGLPYVLLGSTALKVARQLPCSLLIVKHQHVLVARMEQNIADISAAYQEGQALLAQGFCEEALVKFEQCLQKDPHFAHALEGKAQAHARMGHSEQAETCRKLAELIQRELWEQEVTASVRAFHPLFGRQRTIY